MERGWQDAVGPACVVDVWCADVAACAQAGVLPRYAELLNAAERERNQRFVFERDRHTDLVARVLVRTVLGRRMGVAAQAVRFGAGPRGKPEVAREPAPHGAADADGVTPSFNLTHSHGMVMLAVTSGRPLGIDVECMARDAPLNVAEHYFMPAETQALFALPPERQAARFWSLWTLKEALVKASGDGLYAPLDGFGFHLDAQEAESVPGTVRLQVAPQVADAGLRRPWWFAQWQASPAHMAALCVETADGVVPVVRGHRVVPWVDETPLSIRFARMSARAGE